MGVCHTWLATTLGMLPSAIGCGSGGEILQPLGIAVCAGLLVSTFLTLIVVPLLIFVLERVTQRIGAQTF